MFISAFIHPPPTQFTQLAQQSEEITKQCIVEILLGLGFASSFIQSCLYGLFITERKTSGGDR